MTILEKLNEQIGMLFIVALIVPFLIGALIMQTIALPPPKHCFVMSCEQVDGILVCAQTPMECSK